MSETKFSVNNYEGCTVTCTKQQWDEHVISHHQIMENNEKAVKDTIKDPDAVYESDKTPIRHVYFKTSQFSSYNMLTKVVVEYSPGIKNPQNLVGELVTAFPVKVEKGGIGDVVYRKDED